jgi:Barstar (barnase inhibitor).
MDFDKLLTLGKPCFYLARLDEVEFANLDGELAGRFSSGVVRVIRGRKSRMVETFFDEIGAALQFPYYFGENWNALSDCIRDLEWLPGDLYTVLISEADLLLNRADPEDFRILIRILARANVEWVTPNEFYPRERKPTPFHVVLQCPRGGIPPFAQPADSFIQRLTRANAEFEEL